MSSVSYSPFLILKVKISISKWDFVSTFENVKLLAILTPSSNLYLLLSVKTLLESIITGKCFPCCNIFSHFLGFWKFCHNRKKSELNRTGCNHLFSTKACLCLQSSPLWIRSKFRFSDYIVGNSELAGINFRSSNCLRFHLL